MRAPELQFARWCGAILAALSGLATCGCVAPVQIAAPFPKFHAVPLAPVIVPPEYQPQPARLIVSPPNETPTPGPDDSAAQSTPDEPEHDDESLQSAGSSDSWAFSAAPARPKPAEIATRRKLPEAWLGGPANRSAPRQDRLR
jgi:hypothetical protein